MLESFFKEYLTLHPSFGSFLGHREYDDKFENVLSSAYLRDLDALCKRYEKHAGNDGILRWILKNHKEGMRFRGRYPPFTSFNNAIIEFTFINSSIYPSLKTEKDVNDMLSRYKHFQGYIKDALQELKHPKHMLMPHMICQNMIKSLEHFMENKSYIIKVNAKLVKSKAYKDYLTYLEEAYAPLVKDIISVLKNEYLPKCSKRKMGLESHGKIGKDMYLHLIKSMTTMSDLKPEDIHEYGKSEVARISRLFHSVKLQLGFSPCMSLMDVHKVMTQDPKWHAKTTQDVVNTYKKIRSVIDKEVVASNFHHQVSTYDIKSVPRDMQANSAGAFYYPGSKDRKGTFYINTRDPHECHLYSAYTLSLHEGNPGHHYQFQYMLERGVPVWKRYMINNTAFVEGWALYAEGLMDYRERPADHFGRLTYDMFRAVRLVVDTGIHWYGWSYGRAVAYMVRHLAMTRSEIETEVQRYICMPAQALCYKLGEREILRLKDIYMSRDTANIKDFHELLLEDGVLPFDVLREKIESAARRGK